MDVRKRRIAYIILSILLTVTIVIGFTYAFFANTINNDALTNIVVAFDGGAELKTTSSTSTLEVSPDKLKMFETSYTQTAAYATSYIDVELTAVDKTGYTCTFDFVWEWSSSSDEYTATSNKEFTISSIYGEKQVGNYGTRTVIASSSISTSGDIVEAERYNFTARFYNISGVDQSAHIGNEYLGSIKVDNVSCYKTIAGEVLGLVSDNEYTSGQDSTKYVVRHEEDTYEGTKYDAGVRYEGKNPNNYVQFNGTEEWRIIGVFEGSTIGLEPGKQYTKIIKNNSIGNKPWNSNEESNWSNSTLNTYLNGEYLQNLSDINKIAKYNGNYSTWYLRGSQSWYDTPASDWYIIERVTGEGGYSMTNGYGGASTTTQSAIAMMYPSDYGFAAYGTDCVGDGMLNSQNLPSACANVDWLGYNGENQWVLSFSSYPTATSSASYIYDNNGLISTIYSGAEKAVHPTLYLEVDVYISEGKGTEDDPYKLAKYDGQPKVLSDSIIALESDSEYTSSQDGTPYVIKQETAVVPSIDATYTKPNNYGTTTAYYATSSTAVSGTSSTQTFSKSGSNIWSNVPSLMTANKYYHIVIPIKENGFYEVCYTFGDGNINNSLRAYVTDSANSTSGKLMMSEYLGADGPRSNCIYIGYLTNEQAVRIVNQTYSSIANVSFYFQKTTDTQNLDAGIRYEGKDPNNYIQFNGTEEWRIIGVFEGSTIGLEPGKQYTKIIKSTNLVRQAWDCEDSNGNGNCYDYGEQESDWTNSTLNAYLNGAYLQGLSDVNKIAKYKGNHSTWYLRGWGPGNFDASNWYLIERVIGSAGVRNGVAGSADVTTQSAIALMYPSDYGYAAYGEGCTSGTSLAQFGTRDSTTRELFGCSGVDWLMLGNAWVLSTYTAANIYPFFVYGGANGNLSSDYSYEDNAVHPTLYLESDILITEGTGTKEDPYKLASPSELAPTLSDVVLDKESSSEYTSSQDNTKYLVKHEEVTYNGTTYDAGVRYSGENPDNYITFNDESWRILGVFEGSTIGLEDGKRYTKIIRSSRIGRDPWDYNCIPGAPGDEPICESENDWTNSTLNDYLNTSYLNGSIGQYIDYDGTIQKGLSSSARGQIAKYNGNYSTWYLKGTSSSTLSKAEWYLSERITGTNGYRDGVLGSADPSIQQAVGLMNISDYLYGNYNGNWTDSMTTDGWLWTLNPLGDNNQGVFITDGAFSNPEAILPYGASNDGSLSPDVVPTLYLEHNVKVIEGSGTKTDPYILAQ